LPPGWCMGSPPFSRSIRSGFTRYPGIEVVRPHDVAI
jgi:hypothetical protein